jgi:hypothetical protein
MPYKLLHIGIKVEGTRTATDMFEEPGERSPERRGALLTPDMPNQIATGKHIL